MDHPMHVAKALEKSPALPKDSRERFQGYGVMGLPFASGHVLAFRRMVASSVGPAYTAVWHRDPRRRWTMYVDTDPCQACPRYFGAALTRVVEGPIELEWQGPLALALRVPESRLEWGVRLRADGRTRTLNTLSGLLPTWLFRSPTVLSVLSQVASRTLGLGKLALSGTAPNGQDFLASPRVMWRVEAAAAVLEGEDLGPLAPLPHQARLGAFWIPNTGVFAFGEAFFEPFDPDRHSLTCTRENPDPKAGKERHVSPRRSLRFPEGTHQNTT